MTDPFYMVSGGETAITSQYFIGNIPKLLDHQITAGLILGITLIVLIMKINQSLTRRSRQWKKLSSLKKNTLLIFSFFIVFELLLRLPYYSPQRLFIPDPITFWKVNPDINESEKGTRTNMVGSGGNAQNQHKEERNRIAGIFDHEYPAQKPENAYRFIFLGDSQSISALRQQFSEKYCYSKVLQRNLKQKHASGPDNKEIQVISAGIPGYTSWQGFMLYKNELKNYGGDVIVEAFGYHDSNEAYSPDKQVLTDSPALNFIRSWIYRSRICLMMRTVILRWRHTKSRYAHRDIDCTERVPIYDFEENINLFLNQTKQRGADLVFLLEPTNHRYTNIIGQQNQYYAKLKELSQKHNILLIDAPAAFEALPESEYRQMFADSIHFTPKGHRFMAEIVEKALTEKGYIKQK